MTLAFLKSFASRQPGPNRAYLIKDRRGDRLSMTDSQSRLLGVDEGLMCATFVISTDDPDRVDDVVTTKGIYLDNFKANPIAFYGHQAIILPVGKWAERDTDKCTIKVREHEAQGTCYFSQRTRDAEQVFALVAEGILRATSIGFNPMEEPTPRDSRKSNPLTMQRGYVFPKVDLLEVSIVGIPAQPTATLVREVLSKNKLASWPIVPALRKSLQLLSEPDPVWCNGASFKSDFNEGEHPRDEDGQFISSAHATLRINREGTDKKTGISPFIPAIHDELKKLFPDLTREQFHALLKRMQSEDLITHQSWGSSLEDLKRLSGKSPEDFPNHQRAGKSAWIRARPGAEEALKAKLKPAGDKAMSKKWGKAAPKRGKGDCPPCECHGKDGMNGSDGAEGGYTVPEDEDQPKGKTMRQKQPPPPPPKRGGQDQAPRDQPVADEQQQQQPPAPYPEQPQETGSDPKEVLGRLVDALTDYLEITKPKEPDLPPEEEEEEEEEEPEDDMPDQQQNDEPVGDERYEFRTTKPAKVKGRYHSVGRIKGCVKCMKDAAEHLEDLSNLGDGEKFTKSHRTASLHHHKELTSMCKEMDTPDAGDDGSGGGEPGEGEDEAPTEPVQKRKRKTVEVIKTPSADELEMELKVESILRRGKVQPVEVVKTPTPEELDFELNAEDILRELLPVTSRVKAVENAWNAMNGAQP